LPGKFARIWTLIYWRVTLYDAKLWQQVRHLQRLEIDYILYELKFYCLSKVLHYQAAYIHNITLLYVLFLFWPIKNKFLGLNNNWSKQVEQDII
jgi:hypothetical protein